MNTIMVWFLVLHIAPHSYHSTAVVIDNIASADECMRVAKAYAERHHYTVRSQCVEVRKVVQK